MRGMHGPMCRWDATTQNATRQSVFCASRGDRSRRQFREAGHGRKQAHFAARAGSGTPRAHHLPKQGTGFGYFLESPRLIDS